MCCDDVGYKEGNALGPMVKYIPALKGNAVSDFVAGFVRIRMR